MPRHPRLFLPYAIYHVYCRVARGEFIFDDDSEAMEFVERMREVRDLDGWSILAWCLMGNHFLCAAAHKKCYVEHAVMWGSQAYGARSTLKTKRFSISKPNRSPHNQRPSAATVRHRRGWMGRRRRVFASPCLFARLRRLPGYVECLSSICSSRRRIPA
jgi:REP element-mobilizing transposase RayT